MPTSANVVQGLHAVGVGEVNVLQLEATCHVVGMVVARILHILLAFHQLKESLGVDEGVVQVVVDAVQLADRCADIGKEHDVVHNLTDGHAWIVD